MHTNDFVQLKKKTQIMKIFVLWDVTPCRQIVTSISEETCRLHFQDRRVNWAWKKWHASWPLAGFLFQRRGAPYNSQLSTGGQKKNLTNSLKLFWLIVEISLWVFLAPPGKFRNSTWIGPSSVVVLQWIPIFGTHISPNHCTVYNPDADSVVKQTAE